MNCSDAQSQLIGLQGQDQLANVLSRNYAAAGGTALTGPYGTAGATLPQTGGTIPQAGAATAVTNPLAPITPMTEPFPMTMESLHYLNGALTTQIGQRVLISFLIGTNTFVDKSGMLLAVGANYLIIREAETDDLLFCDFFSIKFVRIYK